MTNIEMINIEDFGKLDIRIGTILSVEAVPEADRLLKFEVDLGEKKVQIVSGVRNFYSDPSVLVSRQMPVLVNLSPRLIKGIESQGMILYVVGEDFLKTLSPETEVPPGTKIK
jgi:methionyl-tRNA synthetase